MSLASRTFAPDCEARVESYGSKRFVVLFVGDPRRWATHAGIAVAVHRVANSATEARAAELLSALTETTAREWRATRAVAWAAFEQANMAARRRNESGPDAPALPEWVTT